MRRNLETAVITTLTCLMVNGVAFAAPTQSDLNKLGGTAPGAQLNQTREYLERQRVAKQIQEDRKRAANKIKAGQEQDSKQQSSVKFLLKDLKIDDSKVLKKDELEKIEKEYTGKEVSIDELYEAVNKINALYIKKGYYTCRAFLPAQTIKKGAVHIVLIEGKTDRVKVEGNRHTKEKYIKNRVGLQPGEINNIHELNEDLLRFNATNDVQLRISLQPGEKSGTTDYVISAYEPKNQTWNIYSDGAGNKSSGEWRQGIFYTNRSLSGTRDSLTMTALRSEGTKSFSTQYTMPVGRSGSKLGLNYSTNSVHIVDGDLEDMKVRGHSNAYGITYTQPIIVSETMRTEAGLEVGHQNSKTDFLGMHWLDDTTDAARAYFSMINYGKTSIIYQKHGYSAGRSENIEDESRNFGKYTFNGFWQKMYSNGRMLSARLDGQWSGNNYLASSERFYTGGMYSVRGYEESYIGDDSGFSGSLEYTLPLDKENKFSAFTFYDYGYVSGGTDFEDHVIAGTGVGVKGSITDNIYSSVTLGVPLIRDLNGSEVSKTRIHFMVNGQF